MAEDGLEATGIAESLGDKIENVKPTLFIALGGTGMEICLRLRRRMLNAFWGQRTAPVRISSLSEFPVAAFLQIDLDQGANNESNQSAKTDILSESVKFSEEERLTETFDLGKYTRSRDNLEMYPHIEPWFPITPEKVAELKIDPSKGAGQIRAISRLYFFDKYPQIRDRIRQKLTTLQQGAGSATQDTLRRLNLNLEPKLRVVVIASSAGGTGSGAFLDLGYLCRYWVKQLRANATVDLVLMLPSGYAMAGKERTEANTYAALMELETCMTEPNRFVTHWDRGEKNLELENKPYDDVFLLDTANLALKATGDVEDVYEMAGSALFEDFTSQDFANWKRSRAVNQQKFKAVAYEAPVPTKRFGEMKLLFGKGYSSFGFAEIDTQLEVRRNVRLYRQVSALLKAFFGITQADASANRATEKERDEFLRENLYLAPVNFTDIPEFSAKVELKYASGEFWDYQLTDTLLRDVSERGLLSAVEEKVAGLFETIRQEGLCEHWAPKIEEVRKQLDRDNIRGIDTGADTNEDRIKQRMHQLLGRLQSPDAVSQKLYARLDDKDRGGLDYTISLVEQMKDQLENDQTGLINALKQNALRYREISEALRGAELDRFTEHLRKCKGLLGRWNETQAAEVLTHIKEVIRGYLQFHLRAVAAEQAAELLREFSLWLGTKEGVDQEGSPIWKGFAGELQEGRKSVAKLLRELDRTIAEMQQARGRKHPTYLVISSEVGPDPELVSGATARQWADEAFKDFGGSRELFGRLKTEEGRNELIGTLRNKVLKEFPQIAADTQSENPLFGALRAHKNRALLFADLLSLAMPWVKANLDGDFKVSPAQFSCLIGVADAGAFKREFLEELKRVVPTQSKMTAEQLGVFESGVPGRLMCYVELSGIALPAMSLMETWRTSYRPETKRIPCHTQRDKTWFVHPIQRSATELNALADDFKLFLQALQFGVLRRYDEDGGIYKVEVKKHVRHAIGDERTIRQDGFEEGIELKAIRSQVSAYEERLNSPYQLAAQAALNSYFVYGVYQPKKVQDEEKRDHDVQGFASAVAEQLSKEAEEKFRRLAGGKVDTERVIKALEERLSEWTEEINGSEDDVYASEVGADHTPKRTIKPEVFFDAAKMEVLAGIRQPAPPGIMPGPSQVPPLPQAFNYHVAIGGQASGPYSVPQLQQMVSTSQFTRETLVWREGLAAWLPAGQVPELAFMFGPPPLPGMPPGLPPLPPKA